MFGYFAAKLAAERVVADSGVPWTTLRATQFQQSMLAVAQQMARLHPSLSLGPTPALTARWDRRAGPARRRGSGPGTGAEPLSTRRRGRTARLGRARPPSATAAP